VLLLEIPRFRNCGIRNNLKEYERVRIRAFAYRLYTPLLSLP